MYKLMFASQAAERLRQQYLGEFMSTRLGSQKKVDIVSASSREADGRQYYDVEVRHGLERPAATMQLAWKATVHISRWTTLDCIFSFAS